MALCIKPRNSLFRYVMEQTPHRRVLVPSGTFGRKQAQTATFSYSGWCRGNADYQSLLRGLDGAPELGRAQEVCSRRGLRRETYEE
jgi:hypothetical protein